MMNNYNDEDNYEKEEEKRPGRRPGFFGVRERKGVSQGRGRKKDKAGGVRSDRDNQLYCR